MDTRTRNKILEANTIFLWHTMAAKQLNDDIGRLSSAGEAKIVDALKQSLDRHTKLAEEAKTRMLGLAATAVRP